MSQGCRRSVRLAVLLLGTLPVLMFASGCTPTQIIAANDWLNRPPIFFGESVGHPTLSPDGRLVAVPVLVPGRPGSILAVVDTDSGEVRTLVPPADEMWLAPSFSPDGKHLSFVRCSGLCVGRKGHHISLFDLETGTDTTETVEPNLFRREPLFSPDGRFIVYGSRYLAYENRWGTLERSHWWGILTTHVRVLDLETGVEHTLPLEEFGIEWNGPVAPEGFLDDRTLVISATWPEGDPDTDLIAKLRVRTNNDLLFYRASYKVTFDKPFSSGSPPPRPVALDLFDLDWAPASTRLGIASDTGKMVLRRAADVFLGDLRGSRRATSLGRIITEAGISKSGNRVAFFVFEDRLVRSLWVFDVPTGKVWQTELRERLREGYLSDRSGS